MEHSLAFGHLREYRKQEKEEIAKYYLAFMLAF
jgi:hypothetical protein